MRGLLKASLLLALAPAPILATTFVVPGAVAEDVEDIEVDRVVAGHSASICIQSPTQSSDERAPKDLTFRLDVLPSKEACGIGSVTVNGQVLPQVVHGDVASGEGSITTDSSSFVVASWFFHCVKVNGQPDSQFLKFVVDFVDGKAMEDMGFSALFRQTGSTEILNVETDLSIPEQVTANPNPGGLQSIGPEDEVFPHYSIEQEINELHWLRSQMKELEYLIRLKESAIARQSPAHFAEKVEDCDNLKCLAVAVVDKARKAAHKFFNEIHDEHHSHDFVKEFGPFSKLKKPDWLKKPMHDQPGNHTCGTPEHGNYTAPHWKGPYRRPLPVCRYSPPPKVGGPRHRIPQHNPHDPLPHDPYRKFPGESQMPAPYSHSRYGGPLKEHNGRPDHEDMMSHDESHLGPDHDEHKYDHAPPPAPPPPTQNPGSEVETSFHASDNEFRPYHPPHPPPHPHGLRTAFHIIKFVVIGVIIALLVISIHRRTCHPKNRVDRQSRREERHRRRAFRRAARKYAITQFLARISGNASDNEPDDYEDKCHASLESAAEDGMSTTMSEEIAQFRNAVEVIDDIVSIQSRMQQIPITPSTSEDGLLMRNFDIGSQVGDGEELPAYEDNDGSEMSSVVADGFRYTPGSTEYTPSQSPIGSASDILGPDTKQ